MLESGSIVGGEYRLERLVGEGSMATVWAAVHEELGMPVAVKCIRPEAAPSPDLVERFEREARIAAALRHRFVVDILDVGTGDDGLPYIVMELLDGGGGTLADRLCSGPPMAAGHVVELTAQVLEGLHAAHLAGVIHRDLKPENIMFGRDGEGELIPKIVDFGISLATERFARARGRKYKRLTKEGALVGTPAYMAPEQIRGDDLDHRADLFSVGVVMYEALAGGLPHSASAVEDLLVKTITEDAVPLAVRRPEVGPALSRVVARAMARDRDARFADAAEMRRALLALPEATALARSRS
jgi:serine/threonine-protein kinase